MEETEIVVVGGGLVGSALAYGLARSGIDVAVLDEGDVAFRAARGNFGLVWTQGKGDGMPGYVAWNRASADSWPGFAEEISGHAGRDIGYRNRGGLAFCLGEAEFETRSREVMRLHNQAGSAGPGTRMLDRRELDALLPATPLGPRVVGASFAPRDGHVNPLLLLRGLHAGMRGLGARHVPGAAVTAIRMTGSGFVATRADGSSWRARRIVIAAGIATTPLAAQVGIQVPVRPVRGQNMVTERLAPLLPLPASALRQTEEGVIQIGVSTEEVGPDPGTSLGELGRMARRALEVLPPLAHARMVRAWGALRPMTPDGFPAYAQSRACPGAFVAVCHSGVTLAAVHARELARAIGEGALPESWSEFHPRRFDVRPAA